MSYIARTRYRKDEQIQSPVTTPTDPGDPIMRIPLFCALLLSVLACAALRAQEKSDYVWVEAENYTDALEQSNNWYDPVDKETSLSGNDWWHSFDEPQMDSGYAVVPFELPSDGEWQVWIRLNLSSTGYRMGIDGKKPEVLPVAKWQQQDRDNRNNINHERRIFDETYVAHDGSNRHKLVWVRGPMLELDEGKHTMRLEVDPNEQGKGWASVDAFVLAEKGFEFRPRMHYKPGEKVQTANELGDGGAWPAYYEWDEFKPSPIDLRDLNEETAGEHGFIKLSEDGNSFVRGDGEPIRFWSGADYVWRLRFRDNLKVRPTEKRDVAHKARWNAKRGMNMVRLHGHIPPEKRPWRRPRDPHGHQRVEPARRVVPGGLDEEGRHLHNLQPVLGLPHGQRRGLGSRLQGRQPGRAGLLL